MDGREEVGSIIDDLDIEWTDEPGILVLDPDLLAYLFGEPER